MWLGVTTSRIDKLFLFLAIFFIFFGVKKVFVTTESYLTGMYSDFTSITLYGFQLVVLVWGLFSYKEASQGVRGLYVKYKFLFWALLVSQVLTLSFTLNVVLYAKYLVSFLIAGLLCFTLNNYITKYGVKHILVCFTIFCTLVSILSIAQFHVKHDFGLKYFGEPELILGHPGVASVSHGTYRLLRPYATFPHPNVLAMVLAVGVLFLAFDVSRENITKSRFIRMLLLLLFLAVLVLTFSRGTMVSLLFAVSCGTLYSLLKEGGKMILRETFLIGIIVVLGIGFTLYAQATRYDLSDQSVSLRWELLKVSREVIIENPILGVGLGQVLPTYAFSGKEVFHTAWAIQPVHNFFILFILENGLPLFVIFSIYIVRRVRKWLKYIVSHDECFTWGAFLITVSMLDHYYYTLPQATAIFCIVLVVSQTLCAQKPLKQEV